MHFGRMFGVCAAITVLIALPALAQQPDPAPAAAPPATTATPAAPPAATGSGALAAWHSLLLKLRGRPRLRREQCVASTPSRKRLRRCPLRLN